ncbi:MAG: ATP-binding protein [bacterium]
MNIKTLFKGMNFFDSFDNFPDSIIVINYQKNIIYWNKRSKDIFGFSRCETIGKNIGLIFTDEVEKIYQNLCENKSSILTARTKSDQEIIVEIACVNFEAKEGVIITARDITKNQKIIEKLLIEYEKAANISKNKSSFIASLSHELRTPMHSIIGFSKSLTDGVGGELTEKQEKYISIINRNANSLLALLNNILDLSKIEAGKMEFIFKNFDIVQLINSVVDTINTFVKDKNLEFSMDLSEISKRNIFSDENMLRHVLLNILTNAVKFTDTGSITLKVVYPDIEFVKSQGIEIPQDFADKAYMMFSIIDTGIGIPEEELNNIFYEYRQLDRSMSKKYGGTGLGLAITRKILQELDGVIWVESELMKGSTFNFIIPVDRPKNPEENI